MIRMKRTEEQWRFVARNFMKATDGCSSIKAVNALEIHNKGVLEDMEKASKKMHKFVIDYMDKRRGMLAQAP